MSLFLIISKIWRYKLVTLPIFALVFLGMYYVVAVKAPTYETTASYILVNPPPAPTEQDVAQHPALAHVHADNPYTRFSDGGSVLVQVLSSRMSSPDTRTMLWKEGADPAYTVAPSVAFGFSVPLLEITGTGVTPQGAIKTANIVGKAVTEELSRMQTGVDKTYQVSAQPVVGAQFAQMKASGKLRSLVAVIVLGTILLFMAISVLDAVGALRSEWKRKRGGSAAAEDLRSAPPVVLHPTPPPARAPVRGGSVGGWDTGPALQADPSRRSAEAKR
jgi:hypothetical protein